MQIDQTLSSGIQAFEQNDLPKARAIFMQAVRENPRSEQAWLWLGRCIENPNQQMDCYRRVLALDPSNEEARRELARLSGQVAPPAPAVSETVQGQPRPSPLPIPEKPPAEPLQPDKTSAKKPARSNRPALIGGIAIGLIVCLLPLGYLTWKFFPDRLPYLSQPTQAQALVAAATHTLEPNSTMEPSSTPTPVQTSQPANPLPLPTYSGPPKNEVINMIGQKQYAEAIPYLDLMIAADPENWRLLHYRAEAYLGLSQNQRTQAECEDYLRQALSDTDQSIVYDYDASSLRDLSYLRYQIYLDLSVLQDRRIDQQLLGKVALENLLLAESIYSDPYTYSERNVPLQYFSVHRCEEGMAALQHLLDERGPSAPPSVPFLNIQGHASVCQGNLEKALEYVSQGVEIEAVRDLVWDRAAILYQLGRYEEALKDLNALIEARPYYGGYRYYLRALVQYELGNKDAATADLHAGESNTWGRTDLRSYLLARMAKDDGDMAKAIYYYQQALETLSWQYSALFERVKVELAELGAEPLLEEPSITLWVTPLPPPTPTSTPEADTVAYLATQAAGGIVPPEPNHIEKIADGSYPGTYQNHTAPLYLFSPSEPVSIATVRQLTLHLEPRSPDEPTNFELFLWDWRTGDWAMYRPVWGEVEIQDPGRFVAPNGEVYLYVRIDSGYVVAFQKIWLDIEASEKDGSPIHLGVKQ